MLAQWNLNYTDPWLILTDFNPEKADIRWYRFRSWIECSYRDTKSDGLAWQKNRLRQPDRAEPHWQNLSLRLRSSSASARHGCLQQHWCFAPHDWGSFTLRSVAMLWIVALSGEQEVADERKLIGDRS